LIAFIKALPKVFVVNLPGAMLIAHVIPPEPKALPFDTHQEISFSQISADPLKKMAQKMKLDLVPN
jgi:hypothetical protein